MRIITRESARRHCRTCLVLLDERHTTSLFDAATPKLQAEQQQQDTKVTYIQLATNQNLRQLLQAHVEKEEVLPAYANGNEFPQNICLPCYNVLQSYDEFHKQALQSLATLQMLFAEGGVQKVEIEENSGAGKQLSNGSIYNLMLKDALMETESVVVMNKASAATSMLTEIPPTPDPFCADAKEDQKLCQQQADSDEEVPVVDDMHDSTAGSAYSEDDDAPLARLRSSQHKKPNRLAEQAPNSAKQRDNYRRRTKKEMELARQEQAEKDKQRDKPRKKGTKNAYKCEQCKHSFAHKLTRDAHVRKVHEGSKRPYQCDRCDKCYSFFGGLWTHIREIHTATERAHACGFDGCDKIYTSLIAMQKHRREKHLGFANTKIYVCELCGTTFNQIANLKCHRRNKHPLETGECNVKEEPKEKHLCSICNKQFHSRYTLKYHMLQLHSNDMKFECNVCGRRMAKKFMLVQHMRIHTPERLPCEQCSKQFIRKHELESHVRAVHMKLKPYGCQYCPETFACRKTLRHHEYIHTGEKPYVCDICGQAYRQQTSLKTHRKSHEVAGEQSPKKEMCSVTEPASATYAN